MPHFQHALAVIFYVFMIVLCNVLALLGLFAGLPWIFKQLLTF